MSANPKICVRCGVSFKGQYRSVYCTRECYQEVRCERFASRPPRVLTCAGCGTSYAPSRKRSKYCSQSCYLRCPTRRLTIASAAEQGLHSEVLRLVRERIYVSESGCHIWTGSVTSQGYASANLRGRKSGVHRLVVGAVNRTVLPRHLPVHHKCANRRCVNPDHLEVTTTSDNNAEMMARNALLHEISDLRAVIASELGPDHPILRRPSVPAWEGLAR